MDLGLAMLVCLAIFVIVGFMVFQARFAALHWRRVIREGDQQALDQLLDDTFDAWRRERPKRNMPPADWRALLSAALVAADRDRIRVSILAEPDVRVVEGQRVEVAPATVVAERAAVRMMERMMYEVPYASFAHGQVDVLVEYRQPEGPTVTRCLLTTSATREQAAYADWEYGTAAEILGEWDTHVADGQAWPDPDAYAIIHAGTREIVRAADDAVALSGDEGTSTTLDIGSDGADRSPGGKQR